MHTIVFRYTASKDCYRFEHTLNIIVPKYNLTFGSMITLYTTRMCLNIVLTVNKINTQLYDCMFYERDARI